MINPLWPHAWQAVYTAIAPVILYGSFFLATSWFEVGTDLVSNGVAVAVVVFVTLTLQRRFADLANTRIPYLTDRQLDRAIAYLQPLMSNLYLERSDRCDQRLYGDDTTSDKESTQE